MKYAKNVDLDKRTICSHTHRRACLSANVERLPNKLTNERMNESMWKKERIPLNERRIRRNFSRVEFPLHNVCPLPRHSHTKPLKRLSFIFDKPELNAIELDRTIALTQNRRSTEDR